jgi:hypothetical protein
MVSPFPGVEPIAPREATTARVPIGDQGERDINLGQGFPGRIGHFDGDLMPCSVGDGGPSHGTIPSVITWIFDTLACVIDHGVELGQLFQPESALVFEHGS